MAKIWLKLLEENWKMNRTSRFISTKFSIVAHNNLAAEHLIVKVENLVKTFRTK